MSDRAYMSDREYRRLLMIVGGGGHYTKEQIDRMCARRKAGREAYKKMSVEDKAAEQEMLERHWAAMAQKIAQSAN